MWQDPIRWAGLGVPPEMLEPGLKVLVPAGLINAAVNGGPAIIAHAVVIGRADPDDTWWLNVFQSGTEPLAQMYHAAQILGIPTLSCPSSSTG